MSVQVWTGFYLRCDHKGCHGRFPSKESPAIEWDDMDIVTELAEAAGWEVRNTGTQVWDFCPQHRKKESGK